MMNPEEGRKRGIKDKKVGPVENKYEDANRSPHLLVIVLNVNG